MAGTIPVSIVFVALCAISVPRAALANSLSLPGIDLPRDSSAPLALEFAPSLEAAASLEFDLEYDHAAMELIATAGAAARQAGKSVSFADVSPTKRRFLLVGLNQTPLPAGAVIDFIVAMKPNAAVQDYPLTLSNLQAASSNGAPVALLGTSGTIRVNLAAPAPLSTAGLRSAASLTQGPIASGEIVTLFGTGIGPAVDTVPETGASRFVLGGTSVWVNDVQAPLLYAGPRQINAVVPFSLSGATARVVVQRGGISVGSTSVPVRSAAPAIFTLASNGTGAGAILNQDSTVNSPQNPARAGSAIAIFATGAGQMNPPGVDGQIAQGTSQRPSLPVSVKIGGKSAEILYAGSAPQLISGVLQVNVRIPEDFPASLAADLVLTVGDVDSPAGVTVAIQ